MIAWCEDCLPDLASAASRFGSVSAPPKSVPPTVRKSRRFTPSQNPPWLCGLPKIVSISVPPGILELALRKDYPFRSVDSQRSIRYQMSYIDRLSLRDRRATAIAC